MKKTISSFAGSAISFKEMKQISGGDDCHTWMIDACDNMVIIGDYDSLGAAQAAGAELVQDYGAGFGYCCGADC
jgi:hypothetical protein